MHTTTNMALSEKDKKHIEEEEAYRQKIREEKEYREELRKKPEKRGTSRFLIIALLFVVIFAGIYISSSASKTNQQSNPVAETTPATETLPVVEVFGKTEQQIKKDYADKIQNYGDTGLTPSKKIRITGFDMGSVNVQIDYNVATGKPYYMGYYFRNGVPENMAWQTVGFERPVPKSSASIDNKVVNWENINTIKPFKNITLIYNGDGTVGKIAFSMEDLATAQSTKSLYYVR